MALKRTVVLAIGICVLLVTSCTDSGGPNGNGSSSKWVTFRSGWISLELPDTFKGGDPRDPNALSALRALAARHPEPAVKENLLEYLDSLESDIKSGWSSVELIVWSEPDAQGRMAEVQALVPPAHDGWGFQDYVDDQLAWGPDSGLKLEAQTQSEAYFTYLGPGLTPEDDTVRMYQVLVMAGEAPDIVWYTYDQPTNSDLDKIFRESAKTIKVLPHIFYHGNGN
jgi:hypothetical protein